MIRPQRGYIEGEREFASVDLPADLRHRILDDISAAAYGKSKAYLHRAHHFEFGIEASQALVLLAGEGEWLDDYAEFAPHPFDDYTFSMWSGSDNGTMVECLVSCHVEGEDHYVEIATLEWGTNDLRVHQDAAGTYKRSETGKEGIPHHQKLAWRFNDAFRLLMATPSARVINKGQGPRHAIRKGKRVTFYSKSEITIRMDAPLRQQVVEHNGLGRMMPVYQYRAHLCHSGGSRHCEHTFERDHERTNPYWTCTKCGRRRWHRKAGTRGSAEIGYVRQTYKVLKGSDKA